jgi:hypothetical protein
MDSKLGHKRQCSRRKAEEEIGKQDEAQAMEAR